MRLDPKPKTERRLDENGKPIRRRKQQRGLIAKKGPKKPTSK